MIKSTQGWSHGNLSSDGIICETLAALVCVCVLICEAHMTTKSLSVYSKHVSFVSLLVGEHLPTFFNAGHTVHIKVRVFVLKANTD